MEQLEDYRITHYNRTGEEYRQHIKPTFKPELVEVVEYEKESEDE